MADNRVNNFFGGRKREKLLPLIWLDIIESFQLNNITPKGLRNFHPFSVLIPLSFHFSLNFQFPLLSSPLNELTSQSTLSQLEAYALTWLVEREFVSSSRLVYKESCVCNYAWKNKNQWESFHFSLNFQFPRIIHFLMVYAILKLELCDESL